MPESTVTLSGGQREVFYQLVLDHLSSIEDLLLALEQEDFSTAERLGTEFGGDLRLMRDLGWDTEWRDDVDLTMPPEDLAEILERLRADAEGGLREPEDECEVRESDEATKRRYQYALDTCEGLLHLLGSPDDRP